MIFKTYRLWVRFCYIFYKTLLTDGLLRKPEVRKKSDSEHSLMTSNVASFFTIGELVTGAPFGALSTFNYSRVLSTALVLPCYQGVSDPLFIEFSLFFFLEIILELNLSTFKISRTVSSLPSNMSLKVAKHINASYPQVIKSSLQDQHELMKGSLTRPRVTQSCFRKSYQEFPQLISTF